MQTLNTAVEIYRALGKDNYWRLRKSYDIKISERKVTDRLTKKLGPRQCAACGREVPKMERAHINPLSECAKTNENNLLWLCKEKEGEDPGCHTLFDKGFASAVAMRECKQRQVKGLKPVLRKKMLRLRNLYGPASLQQGHPKPELASLRKQQSRHTPGSEEWSRLQIRIAEVTRRRTTKNALTRAMAEIGKIDADALSDSADQSRYYYEKGYIYMLSGRPDQAFLQFSSARDAVEREITEAGNRWRWAANTCLIAQVSRLLKAADSSKGWNWNRISKEISEALEHAKTAMDETRPAGGVSSKSVAPDEYRHASRWVQNCTLHLVKPAIARKHVRKAQEFLKLAEKRWESMDVSGGWDSGFRPTYLSLYGQAILLRARSREEYREALKYLVRCMVLLIGLRVRQPEGIRDTLFSIASSLRQLKDPVHAKVAETAARCRDFSSWTHPFVTKG